MRVRELGRRWAWAAVVAVMGASPLACTDGTTPDCDSGTVQCGFPPPPPIDGATEGGGGNDGATDAPHDGGADAPAEAASDAPAG
jgi:hypothetical protein